MIPRSAQPNPAKTACAANLTPPKPRFEFFNRKILMAAIATLFVLNAFWLSRLSGLAGGLRAGQMAPDFSLAVVSGAPGGDRIRLSDLRGQVVVVDFWATWCPPCVRSLPVLGRIHDRLTRQGHDGVVLGVNTDSDYDDEVIARFATSRHATYPILRDDQNVAERYKVSALPTLFVVNRDGRIASVIQGVISESDVAAALRPLLPPAGLRPIVQQNH